VFWAGSTFVQARLGAAGADLSMRMPQMGAGRVAVVAGLILFGLNHRGPPSGMEYVLGLGGLLAIAAMGVQEAVAWRDLRRTPEDPAAKARFALGQRIAGPLLVLALICMVTWRYA
jgi:hypothetical protein